MDEARVCSQTHCTWRRVSAPAMSLCCADHVKRSMHTLKHACRCPTGPVSRHKPTAQERQRVYDGGSCTVKRPERDGRCYLSSTSVPLSMRSPEHFPSLRYPTYLTWKTSCGEGDLRSSNTDGSDALNAALHSALSSLAARALRLLR